MNEIDDTDMNILKALTSNARASYRELASQLGVAVGTVQHRMQKLQERGVLKGFMPVIDYNRMGYGVDAIIALELNREKSEQVQDLLLKHKNVRSTYQTTGDVDMFVRVMFKDTQALYDFLLKDLKSDAVKKSKTYIVLDKSRKEKELLW